MAKSYSEVFECNIRGCNSPPAPEEKLARFHFMHSHFIPAWESLAQVTEKVAALWDDDIVQEYINSDPEIQAFGFPFRTSLDEAHYAIGAYFDFSQELSQ